MKKTIAIIILFLAFLRFTAACFAQNVGINTTGTTPSTNAILDLNSGNNYKFGLIIPHVTLGASLTTFSPPMISAATTKDTGMIVYNMSGNQTVGYYYWSGSAWVMVSQTDYYYAENYLVNGEASGTAGTLTLSSATMTTVTSITLPTAGTYRIQATCESGSGCTAGAYIELTDNAGNFTDVQCSTDYYTYTTAYGWYPYSFLKEYTEAAGATIYLKGAYTACATDAYVRNAHIEVTRIK